MKEFVDFLTCYKIEITGWLEKPSVNAPPEVMRKILSAVELSLELVKTNRKVTSENKDLFEGGAYLVRYFDGWGEDYYDKYLKMEQYIKKYHY